MSVKNNPKYPIFIPTKGRYESRLTIKMFDLLKVPYSIVIEKQEYDKYVQYVDKSKIIVLPHQNEGLTATRNWIWDYAKSKGYEYFWTFDDNIRGIFRLNKNTKIDVLSGAALKVIEDFSQRYENIYISGMNYDFFAKQNQKLPPFYLNHRVYSNMFIKTNIPYRNKLFFNDDTDLCLRVLKDGHCTVLFNAFLIKKQKTMTVNGGMTDYYEQTNKRLEFAKELQKAHPDVVKIVWKFNRWHHQVDYRPFKNNKPILKKGVVIPKGVNNYGMVLTYKGKPLKDNNTITLNG